MLDGAVDIICEDEERKHRTSERLAPGQFVYHPAYQSHTLRGAGPGPARYLIFKWIGKPRVAAGDALDSRTFDIRGGAMKTREEVQTGVESFELAIQLFDSLGYKPVFRYQKFREVWRVRDVEVVVDRTPIGSYFEIEGPVDVIRTVAHDLGMNMDQAIRQTYADLYRQHRRTRADLPENMVFAPEDLPSA